MERNNAMNAYKITSPNGTTSIINGETIKKSELSQHWLILVKDKFDVDSTVAMVPTNYLIEVISTKNGESKGESKMYAIYSYMRQLQHRAMSYEDTLNHLKGCNYFKFRDWQCSGSLTRFK